MPRTAENKPLTLTLGQLRPRLLWAIALTLTLPAVLTILVAMTAPGLSPAGLALAGGGALALALLVLFYWLHRTLQAPLERLAALEQAESELRQLTGRLPEAALYRLERDEEAPWRVCFVSDGIEALLGSPPDALREGFERFLGHFDPESSQRLRRELEARPGAESLIDMELRHYGPRGGLRWLQCRGRLRPGTGQRAVCEGILLDITDRKQAEEILKRREVRSRELFDNARDLVWVHDEAGRFVAANSAFRRLLGHAPSRLSGKLVEELLAEEYRPAFRRQFQHLKAGPGESAHLEVEMLEHDGGRRPVEILSRMVPEADEAFRCHCIGRDLTERREAEAELRRRAEELARSNAELERFAYAASHDLQEPLRSIAGYIQLLERRCGDGLDDRARRYIGNSVAAVKRMQALIRDLLEYSRLSSKPHHFRPVDMDELLRGVQENLRGAIADSGARIECEALPTLVGDSAQLRRLFQNLLGNAIKFHAPGRAPLVRLRAWSCPVEPERVGTRQARLDLCREKGWLFCIEDDGIGIEEEHFERIFQIFQRLHTREEFDGTGMGLAICQKIVQSHDGHIWPDKKPDGPGVRFFVYLPLREREEA